MTKTSIATAAALIVSSLALGLAQVVPSPPKNLRLSKGCSSDSTGGRTHEYFDRVKALPACASAYSLRNQAELDLLVLGRAKNKDGSYHDATKISRAIQYVYPNDVLYKNQTLPHTPKDAARLYHDNTASGPANDPVDPWPWHRFAAIDRDMTMKVSIDRNTPGDRILIILDTWYTPEWRTNRIEFTREYKPFRFLVPGTDTFFSLHQFGNWPQSKNGLGELKSLAASDDYKWELRPAGITGKDPISPTGAGAVPLRGYDFRHSVWIRHFFELRLYQPPSAFHEWNDAYRVTVQPNPQDPQGRWHMLSTWVTAEDHDVKRILYKMPWFTNKGQRIESFHFNFHTSMDAPNQSGPIVMYMRNFLYLLNYDLPATPEQDNLIFQRPLP